MTKEEFESFLSRQQMPDHSTTDWEHEKRVWLERLTELYSVFEKSLQEYIRSGKLGISHRKIQLEEENIGPYETDSMAIQIGAETIVLKPIGTLLIGAKGRVDMTGKNGTVRILLVDSRMKGLRDHARAGVAPGSVASKESPPIPPEVKWEWKFVSAPPTYIYQPVNPETIYATIIELTDD